MKRKFLLVSLSCMLMLGLTACGHEHTWQEATCTVPRTCVECGETEGNMLEHNWVEATCTKPKTCSVCGVEEGDVLEHVMKPATYKEPSTCSVCGMSEGSVLEDYFEKNNLVISPCGSFSFSSMVLDNVIELDGNLVISEENVDNKKVITASFEVPGYIFEDGSWGWSLNLGYIDKYTGTAIMSGGSGDDIVTTITVDDTDYEIVFMEEFIEGDSVTPTIFKLNVTCPTEYDGVVFYICGTDDSLDGDIVYDVYIPANEIAYGEYDILYFTPEE